MNILEQRPSRGTSRIRPSWPRSRHRLNPILASPCEHASWCQAQPGVKLFMTTVQVSPQHLLLSGWLLTNEQVNIATALQDTGHTHIYITLALLFLFFFFTLLLLFWAGWLSSIPFVRYKNTAIPIQNVQVLTFFFVRVHFTYFFTWPLHSILSPLVMVYFLYLTIQ
jgi:hypothetical protein